MLSTFLACNLDKAVDWSNITSADENPDKDSVSISSGSHLLIAKALNEKVHRDKSSGIQLIENWDVMSVDDLPDKKVRNELIDAAHANKISLSSLGGLAINPLTLWGMQNSGDKTYMFLFPEFVKIDNFAGGDVLRDILQDEAPHLKSQDVISSFATKQIPSRNLFGAPFTSSTIPHPFQTSLEPPTALARAINAHPLAEAWDNFAVLDELKLLFNAEGFVVQNFVRNTRQRLFNNLSQAYQDLLHLVEREYGHSAPPQWECEWSLNKKTQA
ncbi:hypothetical protein TWF481_002645 [Arthrobotrys musiformis]|uniref:Uncharacterized protein n=1 Tax=Arthrobotrys musiformis TaxID=47236 RepID=A0AAV9VQT6_9PEZI